MAFFALLTLDWTSFNLASYFFVGSVIYVFRNKIPMQRLYAIISLLAIGLSLYIGKGLVQVLIVYGSYITFYFAFNPAFKLNNFGKYGDFSYGLYIYAFPIQQIVVFYLQKYELSPMQYFSIQYPIILVAAILSWHIMEKQCLKWK